MSARITSTKAAAAFVLLSAAIALAPATASAAVAAFDVQPTVPTTMSPSDIDWP